MFELAKDRHVKITKILFPILKIIENHKLRFLGNTFGMVNCISVALTARNLHKTSH
jgi:hypothetical protein